MSKHTVVCGVIINSDGALLVVRQGNRWILPGGSMEPGETDQACLVRHVGAMLPYLLPHSAEFYCEVADRPRRGPSTRVRAYRSDFVGDIKPLGTGIGSAGWHAHPERLQLSQPARRIITSLRLRGVLPQPTPWKTASR